ncbi:phospholipase D-like domain-containing protein [Parahaliea mediterranea]|uniref:PLD phosphodiesterase domain-containing protein n=1 Tax=Parahaliea mediterranea TaxID=651086 RepID=A0A939DEB0_9GAMM|nr:phospholipase D-like domain-containing protein [Parahaliea mediterranea]MBN7796588.1 hypothetical protein [Parahaliea mediterranea]
MKALGMPAVLLCCLLVGCGGCGSQPGDRNDGGVESRASAVLEASGGELLLDNDAAFASKLALVDAASHTIDIAYYIFDRDYSSSVLADALLRAARRGVRVRLLTDYSAAYSRLDWFDMLEAESGGRLEVRFYNRPTRNMVMDAAYVTLGCTAAAGDRGDCSPRKFADLERRFAEERIDGASAAALNISNLNVAGSGDFLAGLYGRDPELMALAVQEGQGVDPEALKGRAGGADSAGRESLKRLGKLWFQARYGGGLDTVSARIQLAFARGLYGEQINPVYDALSAYMPLERPDNRAARRDWDYQSEFLHHKLLWVDGRRLQLGGRNVQDSYHMHPGELTAKYVFEDSDLVAEIAGGGDDITASFERLWDFRAMVATLGEVRAHAPNESLSALAAHGAAMARCEGRPRSEREVCVASEFAARLRDPGERLADQRQLMQRHLARYRGEYRPAPSAPALPLDPGARLYYLENLPFRDGQRGYGAEDDAPDAWSKHIHGQWLAALEGSCGGEATRVVMHNAYFLLPANLLRALGGMLDGSRDCGNVSIEVVTNSFATTDLNAVNLAAAWQLKALDDYRRAHDGAPGAADFSYGEYQARPGAPLLSLHSKVMLFGDALFVGSANADVRSFVMDTNNGLYIENAPRLVVAWEAWLQTQRERGRIRELSETLGPELETLMRDNLAAVEQLVEKYDRRDRVEPQQMAALKAHAAEFFTRIYQLSGEVLEGDAGAAERFNSLLKVI